MSRPQLINGNSMNKTGMKRYVKPILRFVISFGAIGLILFFFRKQLPAVFANLSGANPGYFLVAVGIFLLGLIAVAIRLQLVLNVHETRLSVLKVYYMNLVALFFNNVLPSSVGGDMVKAYYIYKSSNGNVATFSAVVVDRLFGLVTMIGIGVTAIFLFDQALASPKILSSVVILAAMTVVLGVIIFNSKIVDTLCSLRVPFIPMVLLDKLRNIYQAMHYYRDHKGLIIGCIFLTILGQVSFVFTNFMLAKSLAIDISLGFFFYFVPIILIMGIAPSINGIGVREATYLFYLTGFTTTDKALALSLFTSFFMIFVGIIGGVIYAFVGGLPAIRDMSE